MDNASDLQTESAVIDCGVATAETKGYPYVIMYELTPPPFDRMFIP